MKEEIKKRIKRDLLVLGIGAVVGTATYALSRLLPEDRSKAKTEKVADKKPDKKVGMSRQENKKFMEDQRHFSIALQRGDIPHIEAMITEGFDVNKTCLLLEGSQEDAISYLMFDLVIPHMGSGLAAVREKGSYYKQLGEAIKTAEMLVENGFDLTKYKDINESKRFAHNPFCAVKFAQKEIVGLVGSGYAKKAQADLQDLSDYLSQARSRQLEKSSQTQN
ncbi:MAG: hypothetical protein J6S61_04010, partial [Elusimicrobiaceae bacterium]|nr:hypothetical protein [Elusimicrobiaceae bacterium]